MVDTEANYGCSENGAQSVERTFVNDTPHTKQRAIYSKTDDLRSLCLTVDKRNTIIIIRVDDMQSIKTVFVNGNPRTNGCYLGLNRRS